MVHILDASAMVAYLEGEPGEDVVAEVLADPVDACYAHAINLCEVYYNALRVSGLPTAHAALASLYADGVIERKDMSRKFWQRVGSHKSKGGISLPDCFCVSLAQELDGEVVTSDHHEFDRLAALGIVPIRFIR